MLGWEQVDRAAPTAVATLFDARDETRPCDWRELPQRSLVVAIGVSRGNERAAMMSAGVGDAVTSQVSLQELAARMARLETAHGALPRRRQVGPIVLDLLHRDASAEGRWLALHPREFALLWRLSDTPGMPVPHERLLGDVWRLRAVPETNSLQVHVSRLRAKLAAAHASWLIETDPRGGYRLASAGGDMRWTARARVPTSSAVTTEHLHGGQTG